MIYFNKFDGFDNITRFRLFNSFFISIAMGLLSPIVISLKGLYMLSYIISIIAILETLMVKLNSYIVNKYSISSIYKAGVIIHILYTLVTVVYFFSPKIMIYLDSLIGIIEVAVFSSYSISLNNYLAKNYPDSMSNFQIIRNSSWSDGFLLGLGTVTIVTYFGTIGSSIVIFLIFNFIFSLRLLNNWNFYNKVKGVKC